MKKDCSTCAHLGRDCPKTLMLLPLDELLDWCQYVMTTNKITHETLARLSNTPKGTIDRVMARQSTDCRYSTIRAIVCALFEVLGTSAVCLDEVTAEVEVQADQMKLQNAELQRALADSEKERQALQTRISDLVESNALMKEQIAKKDQRMDMLSNTVGYWRRVVKVLTILLGIAVLTIIAALVVDRLNPDLGYIWRTAASSIMQ